MQMTIRNIPGELRTQLEKVAREKGISLNQAAIDAMMQGSGVAKKPRRDVSWIVGSMTKEDLRALDKSVAWSDAASLIGQAEDEKERKKQDATRARHKSVQRPRRRSA
jgi:hypothetical protein